MTQTMHAIDSRLCAEGSATDEIGVIDFGRFLNGTPDTRRQTAIAISEAASTIGFFYIRNHGIPAALTNKAFHQMERFFALPAQRKMQVHIGKSKNHRGYFEIGRENFDPSVYERGDYKEGFHIGRELSPADPEFGLPLRGGNQWPDALPEFKEVMLAYSDACLELGIALMRAFAIALGLPERFFDRYFDKPLPTLRPLRYPPQSGRIGYEQVGCGEHTDFGCLTILAQDSIGGLQVKNRQGKWISAPAIEHALLVNVGDMLARWSNDRFVATPHRVINTSAQVRYSLPFFVDPNFDTDLTVLPTCTSEANPARHAPTTAGRYFLDRIDSTFSYQP